MHQIQEKSLPFSTICWWFVPRKRLRLITYSPARRTTWAESESTQHVRWIPYVTLGFLTVQQHGGAEVCLPMRDLTFTLKQTVTEAVTKNESRFMAWILTLFLSLILTIRGATKDRIDLTDWSTCTYLSYHAIQVEIPLQNHCVFVPSTQ